MQICSTVPSSVIVMPIALDPALPVHAPYLDRLHYSRQRPAEHMHYHFSWELGICRQGSGIFYIGSRVFRYTSGDVSVIAPGVVHIAQSDAEDISGWQFVDIDLAAVLGQISPEYARLGDSNYSGIIRQPHNGSFRLIVGDILNELRDPGPDSADLIRLRAAELAIRLRRLADHPVSRFILPDNMNEISPAVLYIVNHYQEDVTLDRLAEMCMMSVSTFRRAFLHTMRTTPFEYLYHVRIQTAANLLRTTSLSVTEIATRVGYRTLSSFNRHFRRIMKTSPREMRASDRPARDEAYD